MLQVFTKVSKHFGNSSFSESLCWNIVSTNWEANLTLHSVFGEPESHCFTNTLRLAIPYDEESLNKTQQGEKRILQNGFKIQVELYYNDTVAQRQPVDPAC